MRCLLSGNDFCGGPEAIRCHAHPVDRPILSMHGPTDYGTMIHTVANPSARLLLESLPHSSKPDFHAIELSTPPNWPKNL